MNCVPTEQLFMALPGFLGTNRTRARVMILGCACGMGAEPSWSDQILALADGAGARIGAAWDQVVSWPGRSYDQAARWARGQFIAAAQDFQQAAIQAAQAGLGAASSALAELADRASAAAAQVGANLNEAFSNFWGFEPGDIPRFGAIVAVLVIVGIFALAWSPAGQGAILAYGRGMPEVFKGFAQGAPKFAALAGKAAL